MVKGRKLVLIDKRLQIGTSDKAFSFVPLSTPEAEFINAPFRSGSQT
jgi:hypothetical protein